MVYKTLYILLEIQLSNKAIKQIQLSHQFFGVCKTKITLNNCF